MTIIYRLSDDLSRHPERIELAQALTLDPERPHMGLKGTYGLFASPEWWENVRTGNMPLKRRSGIIQRVFRSGQDAGAGPNAFELSCDDGESHEESMYFNAREDRALFQPGKKVDILYALDELKDREDDDSKKYTQIVIELAVSDPN
jgi:hypothetical protein